MSALAPEFDPSLADTQPGSTPVPDDNLRSFMDAHIPAHLIEEIYAGQEGFAAAKNVPSARAALARFLSAETALHNFTTQDDEGREEQLALCTVARQRITNEIARRVEAAIVELGNSISATPEEISRAGAALNAYLDMRLDALHEDALAEPGDAIRDAIYTMLHAVLEGIARAHEGVARPSDPSFVDNVSRLTTLSQFTEDFFSTLSIQGLLTQELDTLTNRYGYNAFPNSRVRPWEMPA